MGNFGFFIALTMLLTIWLRTLLPVINPHSIELEPGHSHIVIGAKNAQEVEQALYAHMHGIQQQRDDHPSDRSIQSKKMADHNGLRVVSLATPQDGQASLAGLDTQAWMIFSLLPFVLAPDTLWQMTFHSSVFPEGNLVLPQEQPPNTTL